MTFKPLYRLLIAIILVIIIHKPAIAVDINAKARPLHGNNGSIAVDSVITIYDDVLLSTGGWNVRNIKNYISFKLDEFSPAILPDSFKVTLIYQLEYKVWPSTSLLTKNDTLTLTYFKNKPFAKIAVAVNPGVYYSSAKILSVTSNYPTSLEAFIQALMLESEIQSSRDFIAFDCNNNAIQSLTCDTSFVESQGELLVSWASVLEADEYDLEWAVIDESALSNYYKYGTQIIDPVKIFENNASRVTLKSYKYDYLIPLLYEQGTIVYVRIRPVQVLQGGKRKEANWSSDYSSGMKQYFVWKGLEPALDWQATTSFAEEGKRKSVVQFYDGSLRSRQTVTKDNVTNKTIIAETLYDYEGRPQIQVLPSPTISSLIQFVPNFNAAVNGAEYDKDRYDKSIAQYCQTGAEPMLQTQGSAQYYSENNPDKNDGKNQFIPHAFGYPFTETKYTQDGTGRIAEQGGVGAYHQLSQALPADASSGGHQTKYYYGTADQEDLDALFGTEVGEASHYFKNMVRDANGQLSISYVDMHGRTIATALAGTPANNKTDKISSNISRYETKNLLSGGANVQSDRYTIQSTKSIVVTKAGFHAFNYSLLGDSLTLKDCDSLNICYDCLYDLEISISDDCNNQKLPGDSTFIFKQSNFNLAEFINQPDTACNPLTNLTWSHNIYLEEGVYQVTKKLSISKPAMDIYKEKVFLPHNTCRTINQFIDSVKTAILSNINCETTCESCTDSIGTWESYRIKFMNKLSIANEDSAAYRDAAWRSYSTELAMCDLICMNGNEMIDETFAQMLQDVSAPSGQYADDYLLPEVQRYQWSIFKKDPANPLLLKYQNPGSDYLEDDGSPALVNGIKPQDLDPDVFAANFKPSWAKSLLKWHPEYNRYNRLIKFKNSLIWDKAFESTETYAQAKERGYLNPTGSSDSYFTSFDPLITTYISRDPFYKIASDSFAINNIRSLMESYMGNITAGSPAVKIWNYATLSTKCLNENDINCYNTYNLSGNAFNETLLCQAVLDASWRTFRDIYLARKSVFLYKNVVLISPVADILPPVPNPAISGDENIHNLRIFSPEDMEPGALGGSATSGTGYQQNAGTAILETLNDNCEAYAQQWLEDLGSCGYNDTQKALLVQRLVNLCIAAGDINHPFGASTVPPGSSYEPKSFVDVVKDFNTEYTITTNIHCNGDLITAPPPYNVKGFGTPENIYITGAPDSCECAKLKTLKIDYQRAPMGLQSFSAYVKHVTGADMKETDLKKLLDVCSPQNANACNNLDSVIVLPPALQCDAPACIDCEQMSVHYNDFKTTYPGYTVVLSENDTLQDAVNLLFTRFMNNKTGLNKTLSEYVSFVGTCNLNSITSDTCDSLNTILADFKNFYYNLNFSEIKGSKKITQCAIELIHTYNAILEMQSDPANPSFSSNYCFDPDLNTSQDSKFHTVRSSYGSGMDSVFHIAVPLSLDCTILQGHSLPELEANTVLPQDFCDNKLPAQQMDKKYYGVATFNEPYVLRVLWSSKNSSSFPYYTTYRPLDKYLPTPPVPNENHSYGFALIKIADTINSPEKYATDRISLPYVRMSSIKKLTGLSLDPTYMPANYNAVNDTFYASYIRVTAEMRDGSLDTFHIYANYEDNMYIKWKETIDSNIYNPDCKKAFTAYFNKATGAAYTYEQIVALYQTNCNKPIEICPLVPLPKLCPTIDTFPAFNPPDRCELAANGAIDLGAVLYAHYQDSLRNVFEENYLRKCLNIAGRETFTVSDSASEYHYTLYYYDQAGNLVKTIPPEGVNLSKMSHKTTWSDSVKLARLAKAELPVTHGLQTMYRYNTLNQVTTQNTPDAGVSRFWYDRLGRLVISQNAKQRTMNNSSAETNRRYSYTLYDDIGRINEVGEYQNTAGTTMTQQLSRNKTALAEWLGTNTNRKEVTRTIYDIPNTNWANVSAQDIPVNAQNLRNRVSYTQYYPLGNPNGINYSQATIYSYDIHGNVDTLIQDYGSNSIGANWRNMMNNNGLHNRLKKIVYQYDLISGKVNHVAYQPQYRKGIYLYRPADAMYHKYEYDAENRLTATYTSTDSIIWEKDAVYDYYKHGPLARTELGGQKVQGLDYVYTIQGWLKGVNSTSLQTGTDAGNDGPGSIEDRELIPADEFGFSLNYFNGDYTSIKAGAGVNSFPDHTQAAGVTNGLANAAYKPLYNGNISSMAVNIAKLTAPDATGSGTTAGAMLYNYTYDQLNRLVAMDAYKGLNATNNNWQNIITLPHYQERVTYDGNGNILTYKRNGNKTSQQLMDDLGYVYNYHTSGVLNGKLKNNQLRQVTDAVTNTAAYDESHPASGVSDIENQAANNYAYDSIGNLIKDTKENITAINWNVYGKITDINFAFVSAGKVKKITYGYDASGNRINKIVEKYGATSGATTTSTYTSYVRDASGNVMAVYNSTGEATTLPTTINVIERHLYGSSRLGLISQQSDAKILPFLAATNPYFTNFTRGNKIFELSNHLGNVLATVSDRKFGIDTDSDNQIDHYQADVLTANDYYPFGMLQPGRKYDAGNGYRYGFNGKENDKEVKGDGNQQDYGMRIYDVRLGKFLSVDPLSKEYPWNSTYAFAENDVIRCIDLDGTEKLEVTVRFFYDSKQILIMTTNSIQVNNPYNLGNGTLTHYIVETPRQVAKITGVKEQRTIVYEPERKTLSQIFKTWGEKNKNEFGFVLTGNGTSAINLDIGSTGVKFREFLDVGSLLSLIGGLRDIGGDAPSITDFMKSNKLKKAYDVVDANIKFNEKLQEIVEFKDGKIDLKKGDLEGSQAKDADTKYCRFCKHSYDSKTLERTSKAATDTTDTHEAPSTIK